MQYWTKLMRNVKIAPVINIILFHNLTFELYMKM